MAFLSKFLKTFGMDGPRISLDAPWPAARMSILDNPVAEPQIIRFSRHDSKVRYSVQNQGKDISLKSTIGGAIVIGGQLYGLTTAHAIVDTILEQKNPMDDSDMDSGMEEEMTSSDFGSQDDCHEMPVVNTGELLSLSQPPQHHPSEAWIDQDRPSVVAYLSNGTFTGDYTLPERTPPGSDFILVRLNKSDFIPNYFLHPAHGPHQISDPIRKSDHEAGDVWITNASGIQSIEGYLLKGYSSVNLKNHVMQTRKIQLSLPGRRLFGLSRVSFFC